MRHGVHKMMPGASSAPVTAPRHVTASVCSEWVDPPSVWKLMEEKEATYLHSSSMLNKHPDIVPRSRALLLTCMMAMCQRNIFVKDVYFLVVDLLDRFLLLSENVSEALLPLVGTTALFLAAKVEKRKTTPISQFLLLAPADISIKMITDCEKDMLRALHWKVNPVTVVNWLEYYLQLISLTKSEMNQMDWNTRQYSKTIFVDTTRLLEFSMLDIRSLDFKYSVLAACAVWHTHPDIQTVLDVILPRVDHLQLSRCCTWMEVFVEIISKESPSILPPVSSVEADDDHFLQRCPLSLLMDEALNIMDSRA